MSRKATDGFYNSHIYPMLLRCTLAALGLTYYSSGSVVMFAKDPRDLLREILKMSNRNADYLLTKYLVKTHQILKFKTDRLGSIKTSSDRLQGQRFFEFDLADRKLSGAPSFADLGATIAAIIACLAFRRPARKPRVFSLRDPKLRWYLAICRLRRCAQHLTSCTCGEITKEQGHHSSVG